MLSILLMPISALYEKRSNNLYVEQFETLDGVQWEISVDVGEQLPDLLDDETRDIG